MTWMNPDAYEETFRCECCGEDVVEDMIFEAEPDYWTCKSCEQDTRTREDQAQIIRSYTVRSCKKPQP